MIEQGGWFVRFQDTEGFEDGYSSSHGVWNPETDTEEKDDRIAHLYSGDDLRLKDGWVFAFASDLEDEEESEGQVGSDDYAIFFDTDADVYNLDADGYVLNIKDAKIVKVVSRVTV